MADDPGILANARHERFAQALAAGRSAMEAYAGLLGGNMTVTGRP